jgi:tripartite-type tricarboxylate transporter receptor subunit TctC
MRRVSLALGLFFATLALPSFGQDWPSKPVQLVVPYSAGGSADFIARKLAPAIGASLGQYVIVENRPGATNAVEGPAAAAKASPDGYTFALLVNSFVPYQVYGGQSAFDARRDFDPVILIGRAPFVFVTGAEKPFRDLRELVSAAKARPGAVATPFPGDRPSALRLTQMALESSAGIRLANIPFKDLGVVLQELRSGALDMAVLDPFAVSPKDSKLRILATAGQTRAVRFPSAPTVVEQGFPDIVAYAWWAVMAPSGTPRQIVDRANREFAKALAIADVREALSGQLGMEIVADSPEELRTFLANEIARWTAVAAANRR